MGVVVVRSVRDARSHQNPLSNPAILVEKTSRTKVTVSDLEHLLILCSEERNRAKHEFEEFEVEVGQLHVGTHLGEPLQKVLH